MVTEVMAVRLANAFSAMVVMPLGSLWKDFQAFGEESFIFSEYDNTLTTEDASLCESLIRQTAEQRLSELLQEEMQRRLGRDDFSLGVNAEGTAWIRCGEDFPQEEAKWILSALLGGCEVQITGGEENNGG